MTTITFTNLEAADVCATLRATAAQIESVDAEIAARLNAISVKISDTFWSTDTLPVNQPPPVLD